MATKIEKLHRQQWRQDLVWRLVEVGVFLGAWGFLIWALASAPGR